MSELLCRKKSNSSTPIISTVKTNQNVTNINITPAPNTQNSQQKKDVQVYQKGQVTALVANLPGLEPTKDTHLSLPIRSKSSLSNVSNTHISQDENHHCHKSHKHKHRRHLQGSMSTQNLEQNDKIVYRKHNHHHHHHRDKEYNSETNSAIEVTIYNKKNTENGHRYSINSDKEFKSDIMDQSYKKATKIVNELTKTNRDNSLYEKHRQKCISASEKYNSDILKHYNARKSTSVLDFRSEVHIGPKYSDSKSVEDLDTQISHKYGYKKINDARSVKSLDFDSDCNSTRSKTLDYASEPLDNNQKLNHLSGYYENKPRPMPPKKPLRLSLHKTQSLQSVETPPQTPSSSPGKNDSRKRNHKGEVPKKEINGQEIRWLNFGHRTSVDHSLESGSWC